MYKNRTINFLIIFYNIFESYVNKKNTIIGVTICINNLNLRISLSNEKLTIFCKKNRVILSSFFMRKRNDDFIISTTNKKTDFGLLGFTEDNFSILNEEINKFIIENI